MKLLQLGRNPDFELSNESYLAERLKKFKFEKLKNEELIYTPEVKYLWN